MKKIIFTLLLTVLLSLSLSCGAIASAEELGDTPEGVVTEEESASPANIFDAVFEVVGKYSGEIFSALACLGSAAVAVTYKKGLFPILKSGVGRLSDAVSEIKENAKEDAQNSKGTLENVNICVQTIANSIERFEQSLASFEKRIEEVEEEKMRNETLSLLLNEQIELLSDVFLSSSLPQYRKELVGERTSRMKKQLGALLNAKNDGCEGGE